MRAFVLFLLTLAALIPASGCGHDNVSLPEDHSVSGAAAGAVGSALASSNPSGAVPANAFFYPTGVHKILAWLDFLPNAFAGALCPTVKTPSGIGCSTLSGKSVLLSLNGCSRGKAGNTSVDGTLEVQVSGSGWTLACGAGAGGSGAGYTSGSTFSNSTGTAGSRASYSTAAGTTISVDQSLAGLDNYQNDSLTPILTNLTPGTGSAIAWAGGVRTSVAIHSRLSVANTGPDYSLTTNGTPLFLGEVSGATSRSVSGSLSVYDNLAKVSGTATFTNVTYEDGCCVPVSGVVTTKYAATSLSGTTGKALNGLSETLTFKSCGTGSLTDTAGSVSSVTLDWCI